MKFTIAIDSFKGSITSLEAGQAAKNGILPVYSDADISVFPMADGGEGTVAALVSAKNGEYVSVTVNDPLERKITARYGYINEEKTAIIEMAEASGLTLLSENERDPMKTTTFGTGELIKEAILRGVRKFIVCIGGSATNDGGVGMLEALGFEFLDENGEIIPRGAQGLTRLSHISTENAVKELAECSFTVACDVKNPLCGDNGCSAVFAPQKGAKPVDIALMDKSLENYAKITAEIFPNSAPNYPGAGAAGGMGFALMSYLGAHLVSGAELVISEMGLEDQVEKSDIVITGEGRLDGQTRMGKVPVAVATLAKKYGKMTLAFSGAVTDDAEAFNECGIDAFFPILRSVCSLEEAMKKENAAKNLERAVVQALRLVKICKGD
jgi:glycerate kinase